MLVAIVPVFLLFARLHGRAAGAVAVVAIVSSPLLVRVWNNDYPAAGYASYLAAGYCCLVMPTTQRRAKVAWVGAGGAFLTLALYSHAISLSVVASALVVFVASRITAGWRDIVSELAVLLMSFVVVSAVMSVGAGMLFGTFDIWGPTFRALDELRESESVAIFHSSNWRWLLDTPHLLVPVLALLMWGLLALRRKNGYTTAEKVVAATLALQLAVMSYLQFFQNGWLLEFHYYFSLIGPATAIVVASTVCELGRPLFDDRRLRWVPAGIVFGIPLLIATFGDPVEMRFVVAAVLVSVTAAGIFALGRLRHPLRAAAQSSPSLQSSSR